MATDTQLSQLIINRLTKAQFNEAKAAGQIVDTELYMITDDEGESNASDIVYDNSESGIEAVNVQDALDELFTSVSNGKALVASAITDKGVTTYNDATFATMAENIRGITGGSVASPVPFTLALSGNGLSQGPAVFVIKGDGTQHAYTNFKISYEYEGTDTYTSQIMSNSFIVIMSVSSNITIGLQGNINYVGDIGADDTGNTELYYVGDADNGEVIITMS